jgi:hypothetical protein
VHRQVDLARAHRLIALREHVDGAAARFDAHEIALGEPRRAMSPAFIARRGSGTWPKRPVTRPVRLIACHWSRMRPVVSRSG